MDIIEEKETTMGLVKSLVGKEVSCILKDSLIKKGKIIKEAQYYYILQNERQGSSAYNKENYKYSWCITSNNCHFLVNLKPLNELTQSIELWI